MNVTGYPCPCCGYRTYSAPAGGTMQVCPVCGWEDAPGETPYNGSNEVSLAQGQRHFLLAGACEAHMEDVVRPPFPEENRSPFWLSIEDLRTRVIDLIEDAFAEVKRDGGMTLHQRLVVNDYGTLEEFQAAARVDREISWQELSEQKIALDFGMSLTFFDPAGIRFHLPAFMRSVLRAWKHDERKADYDMLLYGLDGGPEPEGYHSDSFTLLTPRERQSVSAFLFFVSAFDDCDPLAAAKALKRGWNAYLPDFVLLASQ